MMAAAWLVLGCGGGGQYTRVLDRAEGQNQNWDSITGIDSIRMAAAYMDRHGSADEQVRAHYLLGCAYRDAGEAMAALSAYHDAADRADTTRADCNYVMLMRVHAQSSELFKAQLLPHEMLAELDAQRCCALKAGDARSAINALERSADAYYLLDRPDSVIAIRLRASDMYERQGFFEEAAQALGPVIDPLVDRGDTAEARRCMTRYETSRRFFEDGEPIPRKAMHYYFKGKYCLAAGKTDLAEVYFRRLLEPGRTPQQVEAGYRGLSMFFREKGQLDSVVKYDDLLFLQGIPVVEAVNHENIQQLQALYNYDRAERASQLLTAKALQQRSMIVILLCLSVILLLVGIGIWKRQQWKRHRQQLEYDSLLHEYEKEKGKPAPVSFGTDTPLSALFREEFHGELRTVIESWRPNLTDDDPAIDALAMYQFHFDFRKIMATAVYIDLGRLLSVHALADENISTLSWYLFGHSNLSTSQPTLYAQLRKYKKR